MSWYIAAVFEHVLCYLPNLLIAIAVSSCKHKQQIPSYYDLTRVKIQTLDTFNYQCLAILQTVRKWQSCTPTAGYYVCLKAAFVQYSTKSTDDVCLVVPVYTVFHKNRTLRQVGINLSK